MADLGLFIRVRAQGIEATQSDLDKIASTAERYDKTSDKATKSTKVLASEVSNLGAKASDSSKSADRLAREVERISGSADQASRVLGVASKAVAGFITVDAMRRTIDLADSYGQMSARIKLTIESMEEYNYVQNRLLDTANKAQRPLEEIQNIFIDTSGNLRDVGYSLNEAMSIANSFTYALVRNATSAQRAESALRAYDTALNKGRVDGMMWQSISSAIPTLEVSMSKMFDVPLQKIQQMGFDGRITADMLSKAFLHSYDENKRAAELMGTTVAGAFTEMRNNISKFAGDLNESAGITTGIANSISYVANNLEVVLVPASIAASVVMGRLTASVFSNTLELGRNARASIVAQINQRTLAGTAQATAVAMTVGTTAVKGLSTALNLLGGPVGALTAVASGLALFSLNTKTAKTEAGQLSSEIQELTLKLKSMNRAQLEGANLQYSDKKFDLSNKYKSINDEIRATEEAVKKLERQQDYYKSVGVQDKSTEIHLERYSRKLVELREDAAYTSDALDTVNKILGMIQESVQATSGEFIKIGAWGQILGGAKKDMETLTPEWVSKTSRGRSSIDYFNDALRSLTSEIYNLKAVNDDLTLFGFESQYTKVREITQELSDQKGVLAGISAVQREILLNKAKELDSHKQINAILSLRGEYRQSMDDMLFEIGVIGRTQKEIEKLSFFRGLDNKAKAISIGMSAENVKVLEAEIEKIKELYGAYEVAKEKIDNDVLGGVGRGMRQYAENAGEMADQVADYIEGTFTHMENALFDFARTSKFEFGEMTKAILEDLSRLLIKMGMVNAMMQGMKAMKDAGGIWGSIAEIFGFADGGYTGAGGKYEPAGIVHKGEVVFSQADVRRHGGVSAVEQLRLKGYANGGIVGSHQKAAKRGASGDGGVVIQQSWSINYEGENSGGLDEEKIAKLMRETAKDEATKIIRNQRRAGGVL